MPTIAYIDGTDDRDLTGAAEVLSRDYMAKGYASSLAAEQAALALGEIANDRSSASGTAMRLESLKSRHVTGDVYRLTAQWSTRKKAYGLQGYEGQIVGQTVNRKYSLATRSRTPAAGTTAPVFGGAIGVQFGDQGLEISGVDVLVPALEFTATHDYPKGTITLALINNILAYTATVNSDTFLEFSPGELLFAGASFSTNWGELSETIQYHFVVSKNAVALNVGGIVVPAKYGHDALWTLYEPQVSENALASKIRAAYVEQVYPTRAFAGLIA